MMCVTNKRIIGFLLCLLSFLSLTFFSTIGASAHEDDLSPLSASATVTTTDAVRLRSSAKIEDGNILATLSVGETLTLLSNSSSGWANVRRSDGTDGYCSVNYLNVPVGSTVRFTGVTTDDVNLRTGAGTSYSVVTVLSSGTEFTVTDNSGEDWVQVRASGSSGFVSRQYTSLSLTIQSSIDITAAPDKTPNWFSSSLLATVTGASGDDIDEAAPLIQSISLSDSVLTLDKGQQYTLCAYVSGGAGTAGVQYISSDTNIVSVSTNGTVNAVATGTATVTATLPGSSKSAVCKVTVTASSIPVTEPLVLSESSVSIYMGNYCQLTANASGVTWKSSDTSVVTVSGGFVYGKVTGTAIVTASEGGRTAKCTVKVIAASTAVTIHLSSSEISAGKTLYNGASSSYSVSWSSSDTSVATVSNGYITAKKVGKAVITASNSRGAKTCLVTVVAAEPVRFAYASPNTAASGEAIMLTAVTDKLRTAVRFDIKVGSTVTSVNANAKSADGNTLVWTAQTKLSTAGVFEVTAYSKYGSAWSTCSSGCEDAKTSIFIRKTADLLTETLETRRPSDELISLISEFEGYSGNVYIDTIANNIPTLGYGKVVYIGESFYNDMTKKEAYALLVSTVNNGGYSSSVNTYLQGLSAHYNQNQYDALVCFAYNLGSYALSSDTEIRDVFLAARSTVQTVPANSNSAYVNGTDVNLRSGAGTSYSSLGLLDYPEKLTLLSTELVNSSWYHVKTSSGTEGYIYSDYVKKGEVSTAATGAIKLSLVNKVQFATVLLQYHHAGTSCVPGLLYRRVDELDVFFYGDYIRDGKQNKYNYSFTCYVDPQTKL